MASFPDLRSKSLAYIEQHDIASAAIQREGILSIGHAKWKIDLIVSMNQSWRDLYDEIIP
jgi:predicted GIY-YIG superfamily endonuclease